MKTVKKLRTQASSQNDHDPMSSTTKRKLDPHDMEEDQTPKVSGLITSIDSGLGLVKYMRSTEDAVLTLTLNGTSLHDQELLGWRRHDQSSATVDDEQDLCWKEQQMFIAIQIFRENRRLKEGQNMVQGAVISTEHIL
ncbi:hypothetical protein B0O80DRAFT_494890 [Mortierella sp. GBAus27b]|nr:hypothetical protein B0O80DRAFT_494890 [Mortierella sp. GBAus27b]